MKCSCFTLIELVVVIAIIALLMAILVPFLQKSKQQTEAIICSSNIRQLLLGLSSYDNENQTLPYGLNDERMDPPPPGRCPGVHTYDRMGWWWFNFIGGFNWQDKNKRTIVRCPSQRLTNPELEDNILCGNYGVNQSICKVRRGGQSPEFIGTPLSSNNISHPSDSLLIVDSGYSIITWWHACDSPPVTLGNAIEDTAYIPGLCINTARNFRDGQKKDAINGRHLKKTVNVGFVDGHVKRLKADDLLVEKIGEDDYENISPLWVPKIK